MQFRRYARWLLKGLGGIAISGSIYLLIVHHDQLPLIREMAHLWIFILVLAGCIFFIAARLVRK